MFVYICLKSASAGQRSASRIKLVANPLTDGRTQRLGCFKEKQTGLKKGE